ncbi:hypothetical protein [Thermococcus peptonophilus]|uniref:Uncharacterized protein n=1 Tax=Thermococcus peptonophilus TaxID=53952 RepID=A0A142CSI6_9EURY|nr:hypothetical protein [Thermococcus peptonophilus]AMQ17738.1 hypothetical protein A0127_00410 [Thermococcus peptonophilus]
MPVVAHNLTKVEVEKLAVSIPTGQIQVNLSPKIEDLRLGEVRTPTGKINGVEVVFSFEVTYQPEIARAVIKGMLMYLPPKKEMIDEILNLWEEEKKVNSVLFVEVTNFLTSELSPLLMIISKEMRLPYHIPLPRAQLRTQ